MESPKRFCTSCSRSREIDGGLIKSTGKSPRWICKECVARKSPSLYASPFPNQREREIARITNPFYRK